jgi:prevent-host-death family protein
MSMTCREDTERRSWRWQDAKARFSEVVRLAKESGPQRVTVCGKDAVVVVASDEFDHLRHRATGADLVRAMPDPRVRSLDFEHPKLRPPVRDVNL